MVNSPLRTLSYVSLAFAFLISTAFIERLPDTSLKCPNEKGYYFTNYRLRNPQRGGFVSNTAYVDESRDDLFIGPDACVCGNATVEGSPKIIGNAIIRGNAQIKGSNILISGDVVVEGDAKINSDTRLYGKGTIKSGTFTNVTRELADKTPVSTQGSFQIFSKLKKKVAEMGRITPSSGVFYDGTISVSQTLDYSSSPCVLSITKNRFGGRSSFCGQSQTIVKLKDVYSFIIKDYSSTISAVCLQVNNKETDVRRIYLRHNESNWSEASKGFVNQYMIYNSNTAESIEFPGHEEAVEFMNMLKELQSACQ